jgi:hypothetical protein
MLGGRRQALLAPAREGLGVYSMAIFRVQRKYWRELGIGVVEFEETVPTPKTAFLLKVGFRPGLQSTDEDLDRYEFHPREKSERFLQQRRMRAISGSSRSQ